MEYTRLLWQNIISTITKLGNNWVFSRRQTGELTSKSTCLYLSVTNHFCILWNNSVCKSRISNAERFYFVWSLIAVRKYLSKKIYCLNNWKCILNLPRLDIFPFYLWTPSLELPTHQSMVISQRLARLTGLYDLLCLSQVRSFNQNTVRNFGLSREGWWEVWYIGGEFPVAFWSSPLFGENQI